MNTLKINSASNQILRTTTAKKQPSFKGREAVAKELQKELQKELAKDSKMYKFFMSMGKDCGEIKNIMINAIGTAFVAPIFIAFNPLSKEDQNTKTYSAMRQPISAALAILTQASVNKQFDKYINKLAATGKLGVDYDLSASPPEKHLIRTIKEQNPEITQEELTKALKKTRTGFLNEKLTLAKEQLAKVDIKYADMVDVEVFDEAKKLVKQELGDVHISEKEFLQKAEAKAEELVKTQLEDKIKNSKKALQEIKIEKFVKAQVRNAEARFSKFKKYAGIGVSLAMLPITCSALNWLYPRIMEVVFPDLLAAKKAGGKK